MLFGKMTCFAILQKHKFPISPKRYLNIIPMSFHTKRNILKYFKIRCGSRERVLKRLCWFELCRNEGVEKSARSYWLADGSGGEE